MNRYEARMIAEEYMKIQNGSKDELLTSEELATRLKVSKSTITHMPELPKISIKGAVRYPYNKVMNFLNKKK
jgi:Mn-dependent DtxR family transcriptional regulator